MHRQPGVPRSSAVVGIFDDARQRADNLESKGNVLMGAFEEDSVSHHTQAMLEENKKRSTTPLTTGEVSVTTPPSCSAHTPADDVNTKRPPGASLSQYSSALATAPA